MGPIISSRIPKYIFLAFFSIIEMPVFLASPVLEVFIRKYGSDDVV